MIETFTLIIVTSIGVMQTPGLTADECHQRLMMAPVEVAQQSMTSGRMIFLIRASCVKGEEA